MSSVDELVFKKCLAPKENQKKVNYFEESNNKLPTPIQPLEVIRRDCGELCNTSRDGSPGPYFNHVTAQVNCQALMILVFFAAQHHFHECQFLYAFGNIQVLLPLEE
jgi:hypothetical protein